MSIGSWIVLALVAVCAAFAIRSIVRSKKAGNHCSGCSGCSGGPVPSSCSAADRMVAEMQRAAERK